MKMCKSCLKEKHESEFPLRKLKTCVKPHSYCRECQREHSAKRYANPILREAHKADGRNRNWKRKLQALEAYGRVCACCGEDRPEFLALDHIHGGGNQKRRQGQLAGTPLYKALRLQGYPQGEFRVLCANCNSSLGFYGYCPHQGVLHEQN